MKDKSLVDGIYLTALYRNYSMECAAAISATILLDGGGSDLIDFKGERYKRYSLYCEKNNISPLYPSSKVQYIFDDLSNYNTSKLKYAKTIDDAVYSFNEDYLGKTLDITEFLSIAVLANEIHKTFVSME